MTGIDKLIEAVERGDDARVNAMARKVFNTPCQDVSLQVREYSCRYAYHGSLDAAKELHDALLPGWGWMLGDKGSALVIPPEKWVCGVVLRIDGHNARAWLLAILKAHRSQVQQ